DQFWDLEFAFNVDLDQFLCVPSEKAGNPAGPEVCDGLDNNVDGVIPADETDDDGDGYVECAPWSGSDPSILGGNDCDDADSNTYPTAPEICDGKDNDCDTIVPGDEKDGDSDGYVTCTPWSGTIPSIAGGDDCDDADATSSPGLTESIADGNCSDGADNDCDGLAPDADPECSGCTTDADGDTYIDEACGGDDCDDGDANVNPGTPEDDYSGNCTDSIDNDCDGNTDGADPDCTSGGGGCFISTTIF
ncbi:MAG: hypothetical protein GY841_17920, partial [FCB group bacterium]|nr:hypothetical protein [FCB group bacterium]